MKFSEFIETNPKIEMEKGEEYEFVEMADIIPGNKYVYSKRKRKLRGGSRFQSGDVLFARITPCLENGKIAQFKSSSNKPAFGSTEFFVFRKKEGISDQNYVYYLSLTDTIRKPAEKSMVGASGRQRANLETVRKIEIEIPKSLIEQQKIATILSNYDDLIENNTKRIELLEKIAKLIYEEWFVKFNFPGHEKVKMVDSELGRIPEGWKVEELSKTIDNIVLGGTPARKNSEYWGGKIHWIKSGKLNDLRVLEGTETITQEGLNKSATKMMPVRTVLIAITGAILISLSERRVCANQSVIGLHGSKYFSQEYLYLYQKNNIHQFISKMSGSAQQHINKEIVSSSKILVPSKNLIKQFDQIIIPIFNEISNLLFKNQNLTKTRDLLLPKLITGKVDVSKLEIKVPEIEA